MRFSLKKALKVSFWIGFSFAAGALLFIALVWLEVFGPLPDDKKLAEIENANATLVYSADSVLLGQFFAENRTNVSFSSLPPHLVNALVATEDARFFAHEGVDLRSLLRVLVKSILLGDKRAGGGSTITQQLAKNLFGRRPFGFLTMPVNKTKEMILAQRLEARYSKEQILELYLNTVSFSENTYGIGAGSRRFFGKPPALLRIEEAAVLVGLLKANTYYNPRLHPEQALSRRNVVLHQMAVYGYLSASEKDSLQKLPLTLHYQNLTEEARAPYFLKEVKRKASALLEEVNAQQEANYDLEQDGLRIYTTLDYEMQSLAEDALKAHLGYLQTKMDQQFKGEYAGLFNAELSKTALYRKWKDKQYPKDSLNKWLDHTHRLRLFINGKDSVLESTARDSITHYIKMLHAGVLAIEPRSGQVKVWVGGLSYRFLPFDHVLSRRQAASTFKPVVYATALEQGVKPCTYYENEQRVYREYNDWSPGNYDHQYGGYYSMAGALKKSVNVAAVQAIFEAGINNILVKSRALGIESRLPREPSLALGTGSVSLREMTRAYGVFANEGLLQPLMMITKIETAEGEVLFRNTLPVPRSAMSAENARLITAMLEGVVNEGTAAKLRSQYNLRMPLAGKTGTAQNYTDGWFIGYTPKLVTGVWVGASTPGVHFSSGRYGSGAAMALPVFGKFYAGIEKRPGLRRQVSANFDLLSVEQLERLDCPDFREEHVFDRFLDLFDKKEGKPVKKEKESGEKKNFFQRLFGKKKKED